MCLKGNRNMPKIELFDSVGFGIIIEYKSGVIYSNQTGGTSCLSPQLEGVYVPLRNDYTEKVHQFISPEIALSEYFEGPKWEGTGATNGIDEDDANFIDRLLNELQLDKSIAVNREKLAFSHEAWIHITISADESSFCPIFFGFDPYPRNGLLTWSNSD